ncbi:enterochelin esterase-like enzyme [Roseimicrobium gellanilyticum]|uniref:Enterochelin esterase-like enzyme n=1 Tax=Roseimicrobium gellanilyticum TaxID=748857 RepID=A0A366HVI9_9BACT|nr:alpha/beta hydrolase-fold protein [Roseimicrobium gellanilyticum]RBP47709.1 enterochelin esterase-like enzyme [Roseimicrobium gellanilyticum]
MNTPQEHLISDASGAYSRKVWLMAAPEKLPATRLGVFLDGEYYVNHMNAPGMIGSLQQGEMILPMACVFVSHVDGAARHRDLTCNPEYAAFIARDVVGWARRRLPELAKGGHLIAGPSLGGLASAFTAVQYPQVFARCLSQSGSFWWKEEWLAKHLHQMPHAQSKFWLSVGDRETAFGVSHPPTGLRQEVTQIAACERFAKALATQNHRVLYRVFEGGHELSPWKDELPNALQWLLS